ncbi:mitotic-spindle organizing protein 1 [Condylostylus longicornis]|uniref:mitotic-spindle organizing protein 1 n=1 Tax=Condylostylus longicornis TaxID=2530218 RepID=UPI00244E064A|nr:mitotic-spindle organizing protein 1 [Condylostylus longicornis]
MSQFEDNESENIYLMFQKSQMIRSNIHGISQILNTGLSADTLDICIKLIEAGVHPQALAEVVNQIRKEVAELNEET